MEKICNFVVRHWIWIVAAYFLLHISSRMITATTGALALDEAEQVLFSQTFWFFLPSHHHPPLYTWLVQLFYQLFGTGIFAHTLLKNLMLFATYIIVYRLALILLVDKKLAVVASISLLLLPQIAWESQRDLSHTVLLTLISAATFFLLAVLAQRKGSLVTFISLGVVAGCGMLTKYNYAIVLAALFFATLSVSAFRRAIIEPRLIVSILTATIIAAPFYLQLALNPTGTASNILGRMQAQESSLMLEPILQGWGTLITTSILFLLLFILIFGMLFRKEIVAINWQEGRKDAWIRFFSFFYLYTFTIFALIVVATKLNNFEDRWLQPFFFIFPLYLLLLIKNIRNTDRPASRFILVSAVVGLLVLFLIPGRVFLAESLGKVSQLNTPSNEIGRLLSDTGVFDADLLIVSPYHLAGSLVLFNKNANLPIATYDARHPYSPEYLRKQCDVVIIWAEEHKGKRKTKLENFYKAVFGQAFAATEEQIIIEAPLAFTSGKDRFIVKAERMRNACKTDKKLGNSLHKDL